MVKAAHRLAGKPRLASFGLAVAAALAWLTRQAINPVVGHDRLPFIFFFPAVVIASWYGGLGPGLLATVLGGVAADW